MTYKLFLWKWEANYDLVMPDSDFYPENIGLGIGDQLDDPRWKILDYPSREEAIGGWLLLARSSVLREYRGGRKLIKEWRSQ